MCIRDRDEAVAEYSVFGRVTPQQKQAMVKSLQAQKHTVAMTGDGVNDVPVSYTHLEWHREEY